MRPPRFVLWGARKGDIVIGGKVDRLRTRALLRYGGRLQPFTGGRGLGRSGW